MTGVLGTIAIVFGALGGIGGLLSVFSIGPQRRKMLAEAAKLGTDAATELSKTAMEMLEPTREQVAYLSLRAAELTAELTQTQLEVAQLRRQLQVANRELADLRGAM